MTGSHQVVKDANPSAVSVQVSGKDYSEVQTFPATLNRTASASNAHIDLWTVNIVDSDFSILSNAQAFVVASPALVHVR
jgi:hypothetical protein